MAMQTRKVGEQDALADGGAGKADNEVISWNFVRFSEDLAPWTGIAV
jgi:hypothetical protein